MPAGTRADCVWCIATGTEDGAALVQSMSRCHQRLSATDWPRDAGRAYSNLQQDRSAALHTSTRMPFRKRASSHPR